VKGRITIPGFVYFDGIQLTIRNWHADVNSFPDLKELVLDYLKDIKFNNYVCNYIKTTYQKIINPPKIWWVDQIPTIGCQLCNSLYYLSDADANPSEPKLFWYKGVPIYAHTSYYQELLKQEEQS